MAQHVDGAGDLQRRQQLRGLYVGVQANLMEADLEGGRAAHL